jgi:hypothetical protein
MSFGPYLYRGTTTGWPGNPVLREQNITCTSTDPLVATLFAIECRNHGRAIVAVARQDKFVGLVAPENHFVVFRKRRQFVYSSSAVRYESRNHLGS